MRLISYSRSGKFSNFGDDLNLWLWPKLLPDILDNDSNFLFVGIGTLINNNNVIPNAEKIAIFSTGVGYGKGTPKPDASWKIYCLRGPLSAKALGLPEELAITDGALLIRKLKECFTRQVKYKFSYMPHFEFAERNSLSWESVCRKIGFQFIDPRWEVDKVLEALSETEVLLTEAMHGAIVADALRIPWIPICTHTTILPFKWKDWCTSVGLEYRPNYVLPLKSYSVSPGFSTSVNFAVKCARQNKTRTLSLLTKDREDILSSQFLNVSKLAYPQLSKDTTLNLLLEKLEEKLDEFKSDYKNEVFS